MESQKNTCNRKLNTERGSNRLWTFVFGLPMTQISAYDSRI